MSLFKNIKKYRKFTLAGYDLINTTSWVNASGEEKQAVVIAIGLDEDRNLITLSYSEKMVSGWKFNKENDKENPLVKITEEDTSLNVIKVKFLDNKDVEYNLQVLKNGKFSEVKMSGKELFEILEIKNQRTKEYITSIVEKW